MLLSSMLPLDHYDLDVVHIPSIPSVYMYRCWCKCKNSKPATSRYAAMYVPLPFWLWYATPYVMISLDIFSYFTRGNGGKVLWWARLCVSVCLWVCVSLSTSISLEPHAWSVPIFYACCLWPWLGPPPAGWQNPKGKGQFWGFSSPLTTHCNAFAAKGSFNSQ